MYILTYSYWIEKWAGQQEIGCVPPAKTRISKGEKHARVAVTLGMVALIRQPGQWFVLETGIAPLWTLKIAWYAELTILPADHTAMYVDLGNKMMARLDLVTGPAPGEFTLTLCFPLILLIAAFFNFLFWARISFISSSYIYIHFASECANSELKPIKSNYIFTQAIHE